MPLLDKLREQYGVGPVCSEQHIAPSTYYHCQQQWHYFFQRRSNSAFAK
ncbi:transposase [Escherichia coli]|nr:transposase [Escherichia coli]